MNMHAFRRLRWRYLFAFVAALAVSVTPASAEVRSTSARAGGCFCESLAAGGSVQHAEVIFAQPPGVLRLRGSLGPLQALAVVGILTFSIKSATEGATVTLTYSVGGDLPDDQGALAKAVDGVLTTQLERLGRFVETGAPAIP